MSNTLVKFNEDVRATYGPSGLADLLKITGYESVDILYERLDDVERERFVDKRFTNNARGITGSERLMYIVENAPRLVPIDSTKLKDISEDVSRVGLSAEQATYLSMLAGPSASLGFSSSDAVQFEHHATARTERWSVWHVRATGATFVEITRFNYVPSTLGEQYAVYRLYSVDFIEGSDPDHQTLYMPLGTGFDHVSNYGIRVGRWTITNDGGATPNSYSYVTPSGMVVYREIELETEILRIPDGYVIIGPDVCFQHTWESDVRPSGYSPKYAQRMVDSFNEEGDPDPHEVTGYIPSLKKFFIAKHVPRTTTWSVTATVCVAGSPPMDDVILSQDATGKYTLDGSDIAKMSAVAQGAQIGDSILSSSDTMIRDSGQLVRDELYTIITNSVFSGVENVSGSEWPLASRSNKAEAGSLLVLPVLLTVLMIVAATLITINLVL